MVGKTFLVVKKVANSNRHTKKLAQKAKRKIITAIGTNVDREIYNIASFYPTIKDYHSQLQASQKLKNKPIISILLPTYNTPEVYLRECIDSIIIQSYPKWELCIADDNSSDPNVASIIKEYQRKDNRIKFIERKQNGHISEATNSALKLAKGDFVALMDHDDVLWPNALFEIVQVILNNDSVDLIYSDEDKINDTGKVHSYPFLKPDFSPEFLESCNYITHFSCIRHSLIDSLGGLRKGYEGAQDWDLFIRIGEVTQHIIHLPKVIYSWRIHEASTASDTDAKPYVYEAQLKLLNDHLKRTKRKGVIETGIIRQHRTVKYDLVGNPRTDVVVRASSIDNSSRLISSLIAHAPGIKYRLICINDGCLTDEDQTSLRQLAPALSLSFQQKTNEVTPYKLVESDTDFVIFIEDYVEIISEQWAKRLIADCQLPRVGAVFPVILKPDEVSIYSAGVGIGYGPRHYEDMLKDLPFDDPHYSRGLYAKSRRNISAGNPACFAISMPALEAASNASNVFNLCLHLLDQGYRHVYSPYIQITMNEEHELPAADFQPAEDRYLNPNFDHKNGRLEVHA
jgi:glycosyltransferase involved in cell wall biosynthesis